MANNAPKVILSGQFDPTGIVRGIEQGAKALQQLQVVAVTVVNKINAQAIEALKRHEAAIKSVVMAGRAQADALRGDITKIQSEIKALQGIISQQSALAEQSANRQRVQANRVADATRLKTERQKQLNEAIKAEEQALLKQQAAKTRLQSLEKAGTGDPARGIAGNARLLFNKDGSTTAAYGKALRDVYETTKLLEHAIGSKQRATDRLASSTRLLTTREDDLTRRNKELRVVQTDLAKTQGDLATKNDQLKSKRTALSATTRVLEADERRLKKATDDINKAEAQGTQVGAKYASTQAAVAKANKQVSTSAQEAGKHTSNFAVSAGTHIAGLYVRISGLQLAFAGLGKVLTDLGTKGRDMMVGLVTKTAEFEQIVVTLGAIANQGDAVTSTLRDKIIQLGQDTIYSAQEIAGAVTTLVKAGTEPAQILAGAIDSVANVAAATGEALDPIAKTMTTALAVFNKAGEDAVDVGNRITKTVNASKLDINDYAEALKNAGSSISLLSVQQDDFNALLAIMSQRGFKGAEAGTAIRYFLSRLVPATQKSVMIMKEFGLLTVNTEQALARLGAAGIQPVTKDAEGLLQALFQLAGGEGLLVEATDDVKVAFDSWAIRQGFINSQFFKTNGEMKSMAEVFDILNDKFGALPRPNMISDLSQILGERGGGGSKVAASILQELTENLDAFQKGQSSSANIIDVWNKKIEDSADASTVAEARINTLAGRLEYLRSSFDSLRLVLAESFEAPVKRAVNLIASLVNSFTTLIAEHPELNKLTATVFSIATAVATLAGPMLLFAAALPFLKGALLDMALLAAPMGVVLSVVAAGVLGLARAFNDPTSGLGAALRETADYFQTVLPQALSVASQAVNSLLVPLGDAIARLFIERGLPAVREFTEWVMEHLPVALALASSFIRTNLIPALDVVGDHIRTKVLPVVIQVATWFGEHLPQILRAVSNTWTDVVVPAFQIGVRVFSVLAPLAFQLADVLVEYLEPGLKLVVAALIISRTQTVLAAASSLLFSRALGSTSLVMRLQTLLLRTLGRESMLYALGTRIATAAQALFTRQLFTSQTGIVGVVKAQGLLVAMLNAVKLGFRGLWVALGPVGLAIGAITLVVGLLKQAWDNNFLGIREITANVVNFVADKLGWLGGVFDFLGDVISTIFKALAGDMGTAQEEMGQTADDMSKEFGKLPAGLEDTQDDFSKQVEDINKTFGLLPEGAEEAASKVPGAIVAGLAGGEESAREAGRGIAQAAADGIAEGARSQEIKDAQLELSKALVPDPDVAAVEQAMGESVVKSIDTYDALLRSEAEKHDFGALGAQLAKGFVSATAITDLAGNIEKLMVTSFDQATEHFVTKAVEFDSPAGLAIARQIDDPKVREQVMEAAISLIEGYNNDLSREMTKEDAQKILALAGAENATQLKDESVQDAFFSAAGITSDAYWRGALNGIADRAQIALLRGQAIGRANDLGSPEAQAAAYASGSRVGYSFLDGLRDALGGLVGILGAPGAFFSEQRGAAASRERTAAHTKPYSDAYNKPTPHTTSNQRTQLGNQDVRDANRKAEADKKLAAGLKSLYEAGRDARTVVNKATSDLANQSEELAADLASKKAATKALGADAEKARKDNQKAEQARQDQQNKRTGDSSGPTIDPTSPLPSDQGGGGGGGGREKSAAELAAELAKNVFDAIKAGIEALRKLAQLTIPLNVEEKSRQFAAVVAVIVADLAAIATGYASEDNKLLETINSFAETAKNGMELIVKGVEAYAALANFAAPTADSITTFVSVLDFTFAQFAQATSHFSLDTIVATQLFAESANAIVSMIAEAVEAFRELHDFERPTRDSITSLVDALWDTMEALRPLATQWAPEAIQIVMEWGEAAGKVAEGLSKAVSFYSQLNSPETNITNAAAKTHEILVKVQIMMNELGAFLAQNPAWLEAEGGNAKLVANFAEAFGKTAEGLLKFLELASALNNPRNAPGPVVGRITTMVKQVRIMMDALGAAITDTSFTKINNQRIAQFVEAAGKGADALLKFLELGERIRTARANPLPLAEPVRNLVSALRSMMDALGAAITGTDFNDFNDKRISDFADSGGKGADGLLKLLDMMERLAKSKVDPAVLADRVRGLVSGLRSMMDALGAAITNTDFNELNDERIAQFADSGGKGAEALSKLYDLLAKLGTRTRLGSSGQATALVADLLSVVETFRAALQEAGYKLEEGENEALKVSAEIADYASKILDPIGKIHDLLEKIRTPVKLRSSASSLAAGLIEHLRQVLEAFSKSVPQLEALVDKDIADLAELVGRAVDGIGKSADIFAKLGEYRPVSTRIIDRFLANVMVLVERIPQIATLIAEELLDAAQAFGEKVGPAIGALKDTIDIFSAIMGTDESETESTGETTTETSTTSKGKRSSKSTSKSGSRSSRKVKLGIIHITPEQIRAFVGHVRTLLETLKSELLGLVPQFEDVGETFSKAIGPAIATLKDAVDVFFGIVGIDEYEEESSSDTETNTTTKGKKSSKKKSSTKVTRKHKSGLANIDPAAIGAFMGAVYTLLHHWRNIVYGGEFGGDFGERSTEFAVTVQEIVDTIGGIADMLQSLTEREGGIEGFVQGLNKISEILSTQVEGKDIDTIGYKWWGKPDGLLWKMYTKVEGSKGDWKTTVGLAFGNAMNYIGLQIEGSELNHVWSVYLDGLVDLAVKAVQAILDEFAKLGNVGFTPGVTTTGGYIPPSGGNNGGGSQRNQRSGGGGGTEHAYATGGFAMTPQNARLAELEPEAVIPLSVLNRLGGGTHTTNNYNFRRMAVEKVTDLPDLDRRIRRRENDLS